MTLTFADIDSLNIISKSILKTSFTDLQASIPLMMLVEQVEKEFANLTQIRNETITKYGTETDGLYSINEKSENYPDFEKEYNAILQQKVELHVPSIKLQYFNGVPLDLFQLRYLTNLLQ